MEQARQTAVVMGMRAAWLLICMVSGVAYAQTATDQELPWSHGDDPIGVRQEDRDLERGPTPTRAADTDAYGPRPPALNARAGDIITASALTTESRHAVHIAWFAGLATVRVEQVFTNAGARPTEVRYRLPLPDHAALASLQVCHAHGCRDGVPESTAGAISAYDDAVQARGASDPLPVAHARLARDDRGPHLLIRAAAVQPSSELVVRTSYTVETSAHGGVIRMHVPSRGIDERAAAAEVTVSAQDLTAITLSGAQITDAPALLQPWQPIELVARIHPDAARGPRVVRSRCGDADCLRVWYATARQPPRSYDVALALDASPSMRGPARGRLPAALAAVLGLLPQSRPISVVTFAARARLLHADASLEQLALLPMIDAAQADDLGAATRLSAAWEALHDWVDRKHQPARPRLLIWIGDGILSANQSTVFADAIRHSITVSAVNLADAPISAPTRALVESTGGVVVDIAQAASQASGPAGDAAPLEERLYNLVAPLVSRTTRLQLHPADASTLIQFAPQRAGSSLVWTGVARRARRVVLWNGRRVATEVGTAPHNLELRALAAVDPRDLAVVGDGRPPPALRCDTRGPAQRASGISNDTFAVALAEARPCGGSPQAAAIVLDPPTSPAPGHGMPASPLLTMLRQRLIPVARGCFRRDRAGRADYEVRATFELEFSNQEVASAVVTGRVPNALRDCLLEAVDRLEVPYFTGVVRARYPLRTQREVLPEEIELSSEVAGDLDRLLDADGGALHTPRAF